MPKLGGGVQKKFFGADFVPPKPDLMAMPLLMNSNAVKTKLKTNEMPFFLVLLLTLSFTLNFFCGLGTLTSIVKFDILQCRPSLVTRFNCAENFSDLFISIF